MRQTGWSRAIWAAEERRGRPHSCADAPPFLSRRAVPPWQRYGASGLSGRASPYTPVDQMQPPQQQMFVTEHRSPAVGADQAAQPACDHRGHRLSKQLLHPRRQAVDLGRSAVNRPALHAGYRIGAQQGGRRLQRDGRKLGGPGGQGFYRESQVRAGSSRPETLPPGPIRIMWWPSPDQRRPGAAHSAPRRIPHPPPCHCPASVGHSPPGRVRRPAPHQPSAQGGASPPAGRFEGAPSVPAPRSKARFLLSCLPSVPSPGGACPAPHAMRSRPTPGCWAGGPRRRAPLPQSRPRLHSCSQYQRSES